MIRSILPCKLATARVIAVLSTEANGTELTRQLEGNIKIVEDELWKDIKSFVKFQQVNGGILILRLATCCLGTISKITRSGRDSERTKIFFNCMKTLGADTTAIVVDLSDPRRSSWAKMLAVSGEY